MEAGDRHVEVGQPDLVLVSERAEDAGGLVICVEAQGKRDDDKRYAIPFYQGALARKHRLPTWVVVVSFSPAMSRAIGAWSCGAPPRVDVLLLDADRVGVPNPGHSYSSVEACVLVAALHGRRGHLDAVRQGIQACAELPRARKYAYTRTMLAALSERRRKIIEAELPMEEYDPLWEIEKQSSPYVYGVRDGREEGLTLGRQEVLREMIFTVLELRGLVVSAKARTRIDTCTQLEQLRQWSKRAREVGSVSELFEPA